MTRRARGLLLAAVAVLLGGPLVAPQLPPPWLLPGSVLWLVSAMGGLALFARWVHRHTGWFGSGLVLLTLGAGAAMLGGDWSGRAGTFLPCRRNWTWLPSYLLRSSPTRSLAFEVGRTRVKVCYGAPRTRGRKMIGGPNIPFGHLWRTGANEPFTLRADGPITVGGIVVPGGKASLYTVPGPETWEVIVNASTHQWGLESEYSPSIEARELGRTIVSSEVGATTVDPFLVSVEPAADSGSVLMTLAWETILVRIPIAEAAP